MRPTSVLSRWRIEKQYVREFLAEFIGTFILIAIGDAGVGSYFLKKKVTPDIFSICFCFGIGALVGISASLPVSGAHINPAVTIALTSVGKFPLNKVLHYIIAQFAGGFAAAAIVYLTYFEAIEAFDEGVRSAYNSDTSTGFIFATYPSEHISILGVLIDQMVGTALLMFAVVAITDDKGINTPRHLIPTVLGLVITALCVSYGLNCGATLNPARDLPPRLFTWLIGYSSTFDALNGHYWWVAGLLGPLLGGMIGAWLYYITIELHHKDSLPYMESDASNALFSTGHDLKDDEIFQAIGSSNSHTIETQEPTNRIKLQTISTE